MGLRATAQGDEADYARRIEELADGLPVGPVHPLGRTFRGRLLGEQPDEINGRNLGAAEWPPDTWFSPQYCGA